MAEKRNKPKKDGEVERLRAEVDSLRAELEESKQTLEAIRSGAVDALVIDTPAGQKVFSLEGAERPYRELVEQMQEGAATVARDGTILYCNRAFAALLKRPMPAIVGSRLEQHIRQMDRPTLQKLINEGRTCSAHGEVGLSAEGGHIVHVHLGVTRVVAEDEGSICVVATDLAERKQHEAEIVRLNSELEQRITQRTAELRATNLRLREIEQRQRLAIEGSNGAEWEISVDASQPAGLGDTRTANPRLKQFIGYGDDEFPNSVSAWKAQIHPEDRPAVEASAQAHAEGRAPYHRVEYRIRHKDGSWGWIATNGRLFRDASGRPVRWAGVDWDITERKQAEERLRQSNERLQKVLEVEAVGVMFWDLTTGRLVDANHTFLRMMGYSRSDIETQELTWQKFTPPEYHEVSRAEVAKFLATGRVGPYEKEYFRKDGTRQWLLFAGSSLGGNSCVEFCVDISDRKRAEGDLQAAKRSAEMAKIAAEEASRAKDHFLAVLSHELRNPLTPVIPSLAALEPMVPKEGSEYLQIARRNVELEARLIDDLLDVTRIARGKIELERKGVELCTILRHAAEVCLPDIEARQLHFGIEVKDNPPHWVLGDAARLQQVFWNLIKNAVKFTPHGGCVGVQARREDGRAIVQVTDSGEGIEPQALDRIFNAFEQETRATTRQFGGLGLGLAISRALVEMHGGTIRVQSEGKGRGATFTVELPIHQASAAATGEPTGPLQAETAPAARKLKILLVEDHGDTARVLGRLLKAQGHTVQHAGDVATALDLAGRGSFDVLLSDLGLPDGSGHDLMRQLVATGKRLPAVALSGYGMAEDVQRSHEAGFAEHVTKPVNLNALFAALNRVTNPASARG